ncbi:hypothetical protein BGV68_01950 [Burkholderia ubonensis]|uniref:hypothetical protein n=1 Tax=Burkholderia ubonensis TaxID=101571 RepID=UPI0008FDEE76|nr:hypothetical protein [Burkholderia ubonensis]OJA63808.1 hypothetical protein BGV68_01950 [Burkholderia ubonensis]
MLPELLMVFQFVMHHPQMVENGVARLTAPGTIDQGELRASLADVSHAVLTCYHRTARMGQIEVGRLPYRDASQYGAEESKVLKIHYTGVTGAPYFMIVALMAKGSGETDVPQLRAAVLQDTALIPYARACPLQAWTPANG